MKGTKGTGTASHLLAAQGWPASNAGLDDPLGAPVECAWGLPWAGTLLGKHSQLCRAHQWAQGVDYQQHKGGGVRSRL